MRIVFALMAFFGLVSLAACQKQPLYVDQAYIRLSPNPDAPSAAYFTIHGGEEAVRLRGIMCEAAVSVQMHNSQMKGGMMTMAPVDTVDVPAHAVVAFKPGGMHTMLWSLNKSVVATGKVPLTLLFSNGDRIVVDAVVEQPGSAPPATN